MFKKIVNFFDKLEDQVRARLSRHPVIYTLIGGFAIVLFWRGVWMIADWFEFLNGPVSLVISIVVLLMTGLFVSFFIGDSIIISGLRGDKKRVERVKTQLESEIKTETITLRQVKNQLDHIEKDLHDLKVDDEAKPPEKL